MEKKMATPEYYPLTLNALVNACNQKSNRDPVVDWDELIVMKALEGLIKKKLVFQSMVSRVPKFEECLISEKGLIPSEAAVLCVLLLRGPQTVGEVRGRTERMYSFENLEQAAMTLDDLVSMNGAVKLSRQPGRKEVRYAHNLGDSLENEEPVEGEDKGFVDKDRLTILETRVSELESELSAMRLQLAEMVKFLE
jgi:uncharacterized protein YceH (UPF0502 family)